MAPTRKICLNMIVKNEADKIEKCLRAVADYISCWVIGDTGSTDGTQDIINNFFRSRALPGELHGFPFRTFDQARNAALDLARNSRLDYDYILFVDADMELVVDDEDFARKLTADVYQVLQTSGVAYWNSRLLRRGAEARYVGVTHEYLSLEDGTTEQLDGVRFVDHASGTNRAGKFARDAALLRDGLATETDPFLRTRYTFYLANSLRDDGDLAEALEQYEARARLGYWQEEVFASLLNAAKIKAQLNHPADAVIETFEKAAAACPSRTAEAMHDAARFCRDHGLYERGYQLARRGENAEIPRSGLFVSEWVYRYGLLDEMAVAASWTDRHVEAVMIIDRLLSMDGIPGDYVGRLTSNRQFSIDRIAELRRSPDAEGRNTAGLLEQARRGEGLGLPDEQVVATYLLVAEIDPACAEAFHGASRFCRYRQRHEQGYHLAVRGLEVAESRGAESRHGEAWISDYGLLDELSVHAYWTGRYDEAIRACNRLLAEGRIPQDMIERVASNLRFSSEGLARAARPSPQIPRVFHFVIASGDPDVSPRFSLVNYLAVRSALDLNEGFRAIIHCDPEPHGPDWDRLKDSVEVHRTTLPRHVFGRPVDLIAHRVDVLRMQILLDQGGIYLDVDTICQKPFAPLLDGRVVLGREEIPDGAGGRRPVGLCNATIIAPPGAEFLRLWYDEYRAFVGGPSGDAWNKFSVQVPLALAEANPHLVRIEPATSFFWPSWDDSGIEALFRHDLDFPEAYCFHLWQAKSSGWIAGLDPETILRDDTTYNRIARRFLPRPAAPAATNAPPAQRFEALPALEPVIGADKPRFNLCLVRYNEHDKVYDDVVRVLYASLRDLGHECSLTDDEPARGAVNIVVGNLLHPVQDERRVAPFRSGPFIVYQLEQLDIVAGLREGGKYFEFLDLASHILDYSRAGLAHLRARPNPPGVSFLPPGFHRCLEVTCPAPEQEIDVLFYGSHSERRGRVLEAVRAQGLNAVHLFNVYGEPLWDAIRRSKIILNIHSTPGFRALETVRIVPLLANRCFVVSEASDDNPFGPGVAFCEIEDMAELCRAYLAVGAPLRQAVATEGYLAVRRVEFAAQLRDILKGLDLASLVLRA